MSKRKPAPVPQTREIPLNEPLALIAQKRIGGSVNIRGIVFQVVYSVYYLVNRLHANDPQTVRLEGLEDIDHYQNSVDQLGVELVQVKTSVNPIDAGQFWSMCVLQNFLAVYKKDARISFRVVHDKAFAKGALSNLANGLLHNDTLKHWEEKIGSSGLAYEGLNAKEFLSCIRFELLSLEKLESLIKTALVEKFHINSGVADQYVRALFYNAIEWSKGRNEITFQMLQDAIGQITEAFLSDPVNTAAQKGLITRIKFDVGKDIVEQDYFIGKSARPEHIARGLPAQRESWVKMIMEKLREQDIAVVKSSSGQGKSTLCWQAAKQISDTGGRIYQLLNCDGFEKVIQLKDFLAARVAIGESPLVVVDGLGPLLKFWSLLAGEVASLPVKFIITTREEDWYRYAEDLYKLSYALIDIRLDAEEARSIYDQLRKRGNIELKYDRWQPAWEKVSNSGLLIEYTYLLTQGQMLTERLEAQVKVLANSGTKGSICLSILRLVTVADMMGIKLSTEKVIDLVYQSSKWEGDQYEPLKLLENEYLIKFDSRQVEGLHHVRSTQLAGILHQFYPMEKTLGGLIQIIDRIYIEQFASRLSGIVPGDFRSFLSDFAKLVGTRSFSEVGLFLNGLLYDEPRKYYQVNKRVFDEVNQRGGIEVFVSDTLPYAELNMLARLASSMGEDYENLKVLQAKHAELSEYDMDNSNLYYFIRAVAGELKVEPGIDLSGLAAVVRWFDKARARYDLRGLINTETLTQALENDPIDKVAELFYCHRQFSPQQHGQFVEDNREAIIAFLKRETDTPTVYAEGDTLHLEYLLKNEKEMKMNEKSVSRIRHAHSLLPGYSIYATDIVLLPFPNAEIYKYPKQEAHKTIAPENLFDEGEARLNKIWLDTILKNYEAESVFGWQREQVTMRKLALDYAKGLIRIFEFTIEQNTSRFRTNLKSLISTAEKLSAGIIAKKSFPEYNRINSDEVKKKWFNDINFWYHSLQNLMNQFSSIAFLEKDKVHIAMINLKACYYDLSKLHDSFRLIAEDSHKFFDTSELESEEQTWYSRLLVTAEYFITFKGKVKGRPPASAKSEVSDWWENKVNDMIGVFLSALKAIEGATEFKFIIPQKLEIDTYQISANVGIVGLPDNHGEFEKDSLRLFAYLSVLKDTEIDVFNFVGVKNGYAITAFRVRREFLQGIGQALETGNARDLGDHLAPIPINIDYELLQYLPEIRLLEDEVLDVDKSLSDSVFLVWQLSEYRARLSKSSPSEQAWLRDIESDVALRLERNLARLERTAADSDRSIVSDLIEDSIRRKKFISDERLLKILTDKVADIYVHINSSLEAKATQIASIEAG